MYPWAMAINEEETKIAPIDQNTDIYTLEHSFTFTVP